jgi:hypothetical protein
MTTKAKPTRRIKIDWQAISEQTGCKRGTLCKVLGEWVVRDGNLNRMTLIDPPETAENEELRIEGNEWVVYGKEEE